MRTKSVSASRTRTRYDTRIADLMTRVGHWSEEDLNNAVTYCIVLEKVSPAKELDSITSNKVCDLNYAYYRRLRNAIDRAKVTGSLGAKAIVRMMLSEVYEGHDHERLLLNKLMKHFDEAARTSTLMRATSTETLKKAA